MINFVIGIDAGGTKTLGKLKNLNSGEILTSTAGSASLTNDFDTALSNISLVANDLIRQAGCSFSEVSLVCGAAGAEDKVKNNNLKNGLAELNLAGTSITSDAKISLYGASHGNPAIVVALGTGSVAMRLDEDGNQTQFGGWGFKVGDQGSGAYIGRELVCEVLREIDKGDYQQNTLVMQTLSIIGDNRQAILEWVNKATPATFASLSPLISDHMETDRIARNIINRAIDEVERLIQLSRGETGLPVYLTGGLGLVMLPLLSEATRAYTKLSKGTAVDGALMLAEQSVTEY